MSGEMLDIFEIERFAIHDGPGIRTTVFFQGCPLRCPWCANPESHTIGRHMMFFSRQCTGCGMCMQRCPAGAISLEGGKALCQREKCIACGVCAQDCPNGAIKTSGSKISCDDLFQVIIRDGAYYEATGGGVTLSGGEALLHIWKLMPFLECCRKANISLAVETCGYVPWENIDSALNYIDLFLFDLKTLDYEKFSRYTGGELSTVLAAFEQVAAWNPHRLVARVPVIPQFNDDEISGIMAYAAARGVREVHLLPYHTSGIAKYAQLGREYPYPVQESLNPDQLLPFVQKGNALGLMVKIGG